MSAGPQPVGLVGCGLIGAALASRLSAAGIDIVAFDVDSAKARALEPFGAHAVSSLAEMAERCGRVVLAVFDTSQVEDVTEGPGGLASAWARSGVGVVIVTSTCDPDRVARLGPRLAASGTVLLECPLSGTSGQVAAGDGVGLVAGEAGAIEAVSDILAAICPRRHVLARLGDGNRAKLAINLILGLNRAALAEGLVFAERMGLAPAEFLPVARDSAAYSQIMDVKGGKMVAGDFTPQGRIAQSAKDFGLILDAAARAGQDLPLASVYRDLMEGCVANGEADADNAAVIAEIRRRRR